MFIHKKHGLVELVELWSDNFALVKKRNGDHVEVEYDTLTPMNENMTNPIAHMRDTNWEQRDLLVQILAELKEIKEALNERRV